jgi:predicted HAD superfamily phosphohydrolase YqeG
MISIESEQSRNKHKNQKNIKCVVWDLDNTIWNGVLLEGDRLSLCSSVIEIIKTLDSRGKMNIIRRSPSSKKLD